jgi:hypothetical protein
MVYQLQWPMKRYAGMRQRIVVMTVMLSLTLLIPKSVAAGDPGRELVIAAHRPCWRVTRWKRFFRSLVHRIKRASGSGTSVLLILNRLGGMPA